jgi:iron complex transport system permease protein
VLLAFLAGAALSTAGMTFQALFRNPLATPFTLGVSSGAALGAAVAAWLGWTATVFGVSSVSAAAFAGAILSLVLILGLTARNRGGSSSGTLLLAGIAITFFFSCVILLMQYVADSSRSIDMLRWTLGGLDSVIHYRTVLNVFPFVATGCLIVWYFLYALNLLTTGEDFAFARGINVNMTRLMLFFGVSLMVGAVVAVCGPICCVGLIAPRICRLIVGSDHRRLYPSAFLFGGAFLVFCDTAAQKLFSVGELPVGFLTALLGGPFFLWLLMARKQDIGPV